MLSIDLDDSLFKTIARVKGKNGRRGRSEVGK